MPFNDSDSKSSWALLNKHAVDRLDPTVGKSFAMDCPFRIDAIVCVCGKNGPASKYDPGFTCTLSKCDVVLLLKNLDGPLSVAIEGIVNGTRGNCQLTRNGNPFEVCTDEVLPPMKSGWLFGNSVEYLAIRFNLAGTFPDNVSVRFQIAPDDSPGSKLLQRISKRKNRPRIHSGEPRLVVEAHCAVE